MTMMIHWRERDNDYDGDDDDMIGLNDTSHDHASGDSSEFKLLNQ